MANPRHGLLRYGVRALELLAGDSHVVELRLHLHTLPLVVLLSRASQGYIDLRRLLRLDRLEQCPELVHWHVCLDGYIARGYLVAARPVYRFRLVRQGLLDPAEEG